MVVYSVTDGHGNKSEGVVSESCDHLFLCGLKDRSGEPTTFDCEAYHIWSWAEECGFSITAHNIVLDLDKLSVAGWDVTTV